MVLGKFTDQIKIIFVGDMNVKSGTCNVCSATCSSCMHRIAAAMESDGDCGSSDNIFERKEADSCSFVSAKCRSCNDLQIAASETSNLLSGSSSHDSYSENADSKTVRKSTAYDTYEDIDIPLKVSTVEAVKEDKVLRNGTASIGNRTSCSFCRPDFQNGASAREQYVSGSHGNNDSCITGGRDSNPLLINDNLKLDMKDTPCSSVSTCKFGAKETEVLIQVEATCEYDGGFMDAGQGNSGKLSTFPGESFCKMNDSLGLHGKSDLTEPSTRKNISPRPNIHFHSQSEHISSHNADSKDMEAYQSCQVLGEPCKRLIVDDESSYQGLLAVGGDHAPKTIMLPNNEASKAIRIRHDISSGKFMNEDGLFESAECNLHDSGKPQQSLLHGQVSESDCMLYDVKVCDICGDTGREELLATCTRCIDGAEHTYCMRIKLDKIPEGDWLCEECQLKEELEMKRLDKTETFSGKSNVRCLNKKGENIGKSMNPENLANLNTKPTDSEACGSSKEMQNPMGTGKRHTYQMDLASPMVKKVSETANETLKAASPRICSAFTRENSPKNFHTAEVKRTNMASSPGSQYAKSSRTSSHSPSLGYSSSIVKEKLCPSKGGSASKQVSFKKNVEPKVEHLAEGVPQNLAKESTPRNTQYQSLVETINKSSSFNNISSGHRNIQSSDNYQSIKSAQDEDPGSLKPKKERNVTERKSSFVHDHPFASLHVGRKSVPDLGMKVALLNGNSSKNFESSILGTSKGLNRENDAEYKKVNQEQPSSKCKSYGIFDSENRKRGKFVNEEPVPANSGANNRSYNDAGGVTSSVSSFAESWHQAHSKDKTKIIPNTSRLTISGGKSALCSGKLTKASYATQCRQIDRLTLYSAKPSADVSLIDGTSKRNRWKDVAKAAMSRNNKSRIVDQSECRLLSNHVNSEGSSRSSVTSSIFQKNFPSEGAPDGKVILRSSDTDYSKTDSAANMEQTEHSTKSLCNSGVGDLNINPTNFDKLNEKLSTQSLPHHPSLLATISRLDIIPEQECIWQGAFEILKIGTTTEIVDGIQAHLSMFASPKVHEVVCQFPCKIQLEEVPRVSLWPLQFQEISPKEFNIALYFFAKDAESYERFYRKVLEAAIENDLALKGNISEVELLVFPSSMLPESSQRWNMLFFLWGIFRGRKSDSLKPHTDLQELCESKIITDPTVQELSPSHTGELSTFQEHDSQKYPPKEFSRGNESSGPSTSGPGDICKTHSFLYKATGEKESGELSNHNSDSCPRIYSFDLNEICPAVKSNETNLGNLDDDAVAGKIPRIHANSVRHSLSGSLLGYSASSFGQDNGGTERIKEKECSVKIEVGTKDNIMKIDCLSWGSKPNMKRAHTCSATSGEASQSTNGANTWQEKAGYFCPEDNVEYKRMKHYSEGHGTGSLRDQSIDGRSPFKVQPFVTSYVHEQQQRYGVNYGIVMSESLRCTERSFFPVDAYPLRNNVVENFRYSVSRDDEASREPDTPDLELSLGGKKQSLKKEIFASFHPSVDKGRLYKLSGSTFSEDDMSARLSLSLASPDMEKNNTENPVSTKLHRSNTFQNLFGGSTDT
ncbi:PHD [Musa troglodytarum]|uniref:PHD n=1 Tax=Musa troglodytarum TaxID=320322 RepID=A0A9E7F044_9LILI|nr:PHD [Musa troglodytarum]